MSSTPKARQKLEYQAMNHFKDHQFQDAVSKFSYLIDSSLNNSERASFYADRAHAYICLGRFEDAVADAKHAILFDPNVEKGYLQKCAAHLELKEYEEAKKSLEDGVNQCPDSKKFARHTELLEKFAANKTQTVPSKPFQKFVIVSFTEGQDVYKLFHELAVRTGNVIEVVGGYGRLSKAVLGDLTFNGDHNVVTAQGWLRNSVRVCDINFSISSADGLTHGGLVREGTLVGEGGLWISSYFYLRSTDAKVNLG